MGRRWTGRTGLSRHWQDLRLEPAAQNYGESLESDFKAEKGFAHQVMSPDEQRAGTRLEVIMRSNKDDRRHAVAFRGKNAGAGLEAIHSRHFDIEENCIIR